MSASRWSSLGLAGLLVMSGAPALDGDPDTLATLLGDRAAAQRREGVRIGGDRGRAGREQAREEGGEPSRSVHAATTLTAHFL